jgi:hypothetical protein
MPVKPQVRIVDVVVPAPREVWTATYRVSAGAMPTQSPTWAEAIMAAGGYRDQSRHYHLSDGQDLVVPLFTRRLPFGDFAPQYSPPPAWGFGGILASKELLEGQVAAILEDLSKSRSLMTQIRPNPLQAALWTSAAPGGWTALPRLAHVLKMEGHFSDVWAKQFRPDTRNRIRRAEKAGLDVVSGNGAELIGEFYQLLKLSLVRWARHQHEPAALALWRGQHRDPEAKFHALARLAGDTFRLWLARLDGRPVAAILVLKDREAHYTRGAMDEDVAGRTYANYLLHSRAIEDACQAGCRYYHMGESGRSQSLAQFKSRFGAEPVPYAEYRFERLPVSWLKDGARRVVKRIIGFRDA